MAWRILAADVTPAYQAAPSDSSISFTKGPPGLVNPSVLLGLSQGSSPTASGWTSGHAPKSAPLGRHWRGGRLRSRSRRATRTGAGRRGRPARRAPRRPPRAARRGRGLSIILGFGRAREVRAAGDELEVLSPTRLLHLPRLPVDGPVEFAAHRKRPFRSTSALSDQGRCIHC